MKIYTKTGDKGQTSLLGGQRVEKNHPKLKAYGTVDELNSQIGLLQSFISSEIPHSDIEQKFIFQIQNHLFLLGSHIACFKDSDRKKFKIQDFEDTKITFLEEGIDSLEQDLPPLQNFILPGGCKSSSQAHICRTVCRRAERLIAALPDHDPIWLMYLNRLSDYFFVLARHLNHLQKIEDVIWKQDL